MRFWRVAKASLFFIGRSLGKFSLGILFGVRICGMRLHPQTPETVEDFKLFGIRRKIAGRDHAWLRASSAAYPAYNGNIPRKERLCAWPAKTPFSYYEYVIFLR